MTSSQVETIASAAARLASHSSVTRLSDVLRQQQKTRCRLETESLQTAKEKKRQFESAQARGDGTSLPTRTPIADVVAPLRRSAKIPI